MLLEIQHLNFRNGNFSLHDVSLSIPDGSILGIGGQNGSGKSTLLKLMYGFHKPNSGTIRLDSIPLQSLSTREISRKIAVVNQEISDPFNFTALDVVKLSGYSRTDDDITPENALETCGITHLSNRVFSELSGGEKRLVTIAAAIYQDARIILMDEPTAFLDVDKEYTVRKIIHNLREKGKTIVLVLHDINMLNSVCSHVVLLKDGGVIACGTTDEVLVLENLENAYSVKFRILEDAGPYKFAPAEKYFR